MAVATPEPDTLSATDQAACRRLLRGGSRSFYAASFLLPARVRVRASALYAFCRIADDAIDQAKEPAAALADLHARLEAGYAGSPWDHPEDRALAAVVHAHGIPRVLLLALLEGFAWDAAGRHYEDLPDLLAYATRVAGSVGAMMAALMHVREPHLVARACDLGIAMQLTNIARDVGEDARAGRLYLPRRWLREAGIDADAWLAAPVFSRPLAGVIRRLLRVADGFYRRADAGIAGLPAGCRPGIYAARLFYAAIGHELERSGLDAVTHRAVVPAAAKAGLLARLPAVMALDRGALMAPPQTEAAYLVDALVDAGRDRLFGPRTVGQRVAWVLELFQDLEQRERRGASPRPLADERAA